MKGVAIAASSEVETGKLIISTAKRLKAYAIGDRKIAGYFSATTVSGRAGLLASALRNHKSLSGKRFHALCLEEGFNRNDVRVTLIPWLRREGLAEVHSVDGEPTSVTSLILLYEAILRAVTHMFEDLDPTVEERGALLVLDIVSSLPSPESVVLQVLSGEISEQTAISSLKLAKSYHIVETYAGKGRGETILYSPRVWRNAMGRVAQALSSLTPDERAGIQFLVDSVRKYQGYPGDVLRSVAAKHGITNMLDLGIGVGLIVETWIELGGGNRRSFLTTPHFHADMAAEHGDDVCDRVKLFLDSIRNGQHYGLPWTGRITDPSRLLQKLINTGEIGPCTAIGRDYTMVERAGIVDVKRSKSKPGLYIMNLVQEDTVQQVYEVITKGQVLGASSMSPAELGPDGRFVSAEEGRLAEVPGEVAEAERAIILNLREG